MSLCSRPGVCLPPQESQTCVCKCLQKKEAKKKRKKKKNDRADADSLLPHMASERGPAFSGVCAPGAGQSNLFTVRALMVIFYDVV